MTLRELVAKALRETRQDVAAATQLARKWILDDQALFAELVLPMVDARLDDIARGLVAANPGNAGARHPGVHAMVSESVRKGHQLVAEGRLLAYPLRSGKPLGDASKAELVAEAEALMDAGRQCLVYGKWLRMIARVLKQDGDVVKGHVSEERLLSLKETAEHLVEAADVAR